MSHSPSEYCHDAWCGKTAIRWRKSLKIYLLVFAEYIPERDGQTDGFRAAKKTSFTSHCQWWMFDVELTADCSVPFSSSLVDVWRVHSIWWYGEVSDVIVRVETNSSPMTSTTVVGRRLLAPAAAPIGATSTRSWLGTDWFWPASESTQSTPEWRRAGGRTRRAVRPARAARPGRWVDRWRFRRNWKKTVLMFSITPNWCCYSWCMHIYTVTVRELEFYEFWKSFNCRTLRLYIVPVLR